MPNSKIKTTVLNSYHDLKIEGEKCEVKDLERRRKIKMKNTKQRIKVKNISSWDVTPRRDPDEIRNNIHNFQKFEVKKIFNAFRRSSYAVVCYLNKVM